MRRFMVIVAAAALGSSASAALAQVHLTGRSAADDQLQHDIVQQVSLLGGTECEAPSEIRASVIHPSRIPSTAEYRAPSDNASYEEWDANFCGKLSPVLVTFWPDPNGGSFIVVTYPYPEDAPRGAH